MRRLLMISALLLALGAPVTTPAQAQIGVGFGFGGGVFFDDRFDDIRIGAVARKAIEQHLNSEYKRLCTNKKNVPDICLEQRPLYKSSSLSVPSTPLSAELQKKVGFVYPGTQYRQVGFTVYLIHLNNRRIHDLVSLWDDGWK